MNFKNIVKKDIENLFLNLSEFGDIHNFNGRELKCIVDEDAFRRKMEKNNSLITIDGILKKGMTLFFNKKDLKVRPYAGEIIEFDNIEYTVASCKEDFDLIELDVYLYSEVGEYENGFY